MSESERKRRQEYKRNRKRWIIILSVALAVAMLVALVSHLIYVKMNETYYIEYTESSSLDYKVQYKENTFFEEEWIGPGQSYVSGLANSIFASFDYRMNMAANKVAFDYSYEITAQLIIADKNTGAHIYDPVDILVPKLTGTVSQSNKLAITKGVDVDFGKYNRLSQEFINVYGLRNVTSSLLVTMEVDVLSASDEFETNNENIHTVSMSLPLGVESFAITSQTGLPAGESKVLACKNNAGQAAMFSTSIASAVTAVLLALLLVAFVYLTKNEDINYANKVRRLLSAYRSFIQQIHGEFDTRGYQIVPVKTFTEMLGIRDTIQSPVLMSENEDETRAQFLIPTNTKLLYLFEIKVENYDELYGIKSEDDAESDVEMAPVTTAPEVAPVAISVTEEAIAEEVVVEEPVAEEPVAEEVVVEEPVAEEAIVEEAIVEEAIVEEAIVEEAIVEEPVAEEAVAEEAIVEEAIVEEPVAVETEEVVYDTEDDELNDDDSDGSIVFYDENENKLSIKCRRSCLANIIQSENDGAKSYYSAIKNHILSYKGVKARMSWRFESFKKGRSQLAKLKLRGKTVCLYCALDGNEFDVNKYYHKVTDAKMFEDVPMMVKIKSDGALKRALTLIDLIMERFGIDKDPKFTEVDYVEMHPYERTQPLIDRGLVKILVPDGYVVVDPHHIVKAEALAQMKAEQLVETVDENEVAQLAFPVELEDAVKEVLTHGDAQEEADITVAEIEHVIEDALAEPDMELEQIDFVDEIDEVYEETVEKPGVEVVGVVWPERPHKNKLYRYDPNGEKLDENDIVLVPTRDVHRNREVIRKATVAHGNHTVDPDTIKHPLKKIIAVLKHNMEVMLTPNEQKRKKNNSDKQKGSKD